MTVPGVTVRPSAATGAAVLAFIQVGMTIFPTLLLLNVVGNGVDPFGWILAFAQVAGIVLLVVGGVRVLGGSGRRLLVLAAGVELLACVGWEFPMHLASIGDDVHFFVEDMTVAPIAFAALPAIIIWLAATRDVADWTRPKRAT